MNFITSANAPKAVGPYSQAVTQDRFIFCSGQIGIDPTTGTLVTGIENQVKQVLKNLAAVLKEAGSAKEDVIKTTVYVVNMDDYPVLNQLYAEFFGEHKPARATVSVSKLPAGALVEIDCIAKR
ncbi:MAG: Rid family detoxifying hydrolase [bacterium]